MWHGLSTRVRQYGRSRGGSPSARTSTCARLMPGDWARSKHATSRAWLTTSTVALRLVPRRHGSTCKWCKPSTTIGSTPTWSACTSPTSCATTPCTSPSSPGLSRRAVGAQTGGLPGATPARLLLFAIKLRTVMGTGCPTRPPCGRQRHRRALPAGSDTNAHLGGYNGASGPATRKRALMRERLLFRCGKPARRTCRARRTGSGSRWHAAAGRRDRGEVRSESRELAVLALDHPHDDRVASHAGACVREDLADAALGAGPGDGEVVLAEVDQLRVVDVDRQLVGHERPDQRERRQRRHRRRPGRATAPRPATARPGRSIERTSAK